jgi:hypothetical protein
MNWNNAALITSPPVVSSGGNLSGVAAFNNGTNFTFALQASTAAIYSLVVDVNAAGQGALNTMTVSGLATMSVANADVWITDVPANLSFTDVDDPSDNYDAIVARMRSLESQIVHMRRLATIDEKSDAYDDCHSNDDVSEHGEPEFAEQARKARPPLKGDYVIRSDGSVVPLSECAAPLKSKASLSSSVLNSLGLA